MKNLVLGIYANVNDANMTVDMLKDHNYTEDVSTVMKEGITNEIKSSQEKEGVANGAAAGAVTGGIVGGIAGLVAAASTVAVPGLGTILVTGPLLSLLGITGGALTGTIIGALVDLGIPEEKAKEFSDFITRGEVLVAVTTEFEEKIDDISSIMRQSSAREVIVTKIEK